MAIVYSSGTEDIPPAVRRGPNERTADGIDILPVAAFLARLEGQSLFP
jgi:hypothetical protein